MLGCGNHSCYINPPENWGTTGSCSCLDYLDKDLQRFLKRKIFEAEFYRLRVEELEKHKDKFPEPYLTCICNILANGKIEP